MKTLVKRNRFFPEVPSFYDEFFNSDWFDLGQSNFATRRSEEHTSELQSH